VDVRADGKLVGELDLDLVTHLEVDARTGDHPVVRPGLDDLARPDLPVDDRRGQLEALGAVGQDFRGERLVAPARGLGRELHDRLDHRHVLRRALLGGRRLVTAVVGRPAGGGPLAPHDEGGRHAGLGVAGDRAVDLVGAGVESAEVELLALAGGEVGGDQIAAADGEVVHHRAVVANGQHARGVDLGDGQVDGVLREAGVDGLAPGRGTTAAVVVGGPQGEADADDAGEGGEDGESEHQDRPRVPAHPVLPQVLLEGFEASLVVVWRSAFGQRRGHGPILR
jgi:hypothetical protein